jgi:hypothetical protein
MWIENETQSRIGTLCIDNGGEHTYNEFEIYIFQHGIKHQTIVPYNPQQNGVEKRMNMTLLNIVCSMLFFKNVKLMFWGDAVLCAMYLRKTSPHNSLGNNIHYELWYHIPLVRLF